MKDITKDLQQRLRQIETQRVNLQKQLDALVMQENAVKTLVDAEIARWRSQQPPLALDLPTAKEHQQNALSKLILGSLAKGVKNTETLAREVKESNIPVNGKPGRVVWGTLLGLSKSGKIERSNGMWRLKSE